MVLEMTLRINLSIEYKLLVLKFKISEQAIEGIISVSSS